MTIYDLGIIGCGPVGLFATSFAQLHGLKTISFESLSNSGGQVQMLYPNKKIKDIPTYKEITGKTLIYNLTNSSKFMNNYPVNSLEKNDDYFFVNSEIKCKSIIIATGIGAFKPKKLPFRITNSKLIPHIHYMLTNPQNFKGKEISILGGGDTALDWAEQLSEYCKEITIIHRRNDFRGLESTLRNLNKLNNVKILTPYLPKSIELLDNQLIFNLKKLKENTSISKSFDEAFIAYGFNSDNSFIKKWNIDFENNFIKVDRKMETNIPGIFAIGDIVTYEGRIPMIALGFGEAQIAVSNIMNNLFPEKKITLHSTSI